MKRPEGKSILVAGSGGIGAEFGVDGGATMRL